MLNREWLAPHYQVRSVHTQCSEIASLGRV